MWLKPASGHDAFWGSCAVISHQHHAKHVTAVAPPQDHSGVAGGGTRRVGVTFEAVSPQQVWRAGGDTLSPTRLRSRPHIQFLSCRLQLHLNHLPIRATLSAPRRVPTSQEPTSFLVPRNSLALHDASPIRLTLPFN